LPAGRDCRDRGRTGKALLARVWRWSVSAWRDLGRQVLPVAPVSEVTGFAIRDRTGEETPVPPGAGGWSRPAPAGGGGDGARAADDPGGRVGGDRLRGRVSAGWAGVPADLRQAVLLLAAHYYEHRHEVVAGGGMPQGVAAMIERYRNDPAVRRVRAMRLNRRLVLEEAERVPDGAGGFAEVWVARGVLWGHVRAGSRARGGGGCRDAVDGALPDHGAGGAGGRAVAAAARPAVPRRRPDLPHLAVTEEEGQGAYLVCFAREEVAA
jgi:uncharacterized phiE125 gp8 family phage protein